MTATRDLVERVVPDGESEMCDVCGHALTLHDRVAERYCDATLRNALSRKCVCSASPVAQYRR